MHAIAFLQDLAVVMIVAGLVTVIFHRLKQPVVLGYILAGVIIGPHTPPFPLINSEETITTLSQLGLIFLMFSLGLEFHLRKLKTVGMAAAVAAFFKIVFTLWLGYMLGRIFGWSGMDSIFLGAMLSISSTTIIVKALRELGLAKERFSQLIFGILIVEDVIAIVMIAVLSGFAVSGSFQTMDVMRTVGKLAVFVVAFLVVGLLAVPRLIGYVSRFKSNEMLLVTVLGLCFGTSLMVVKLGYSVALGAFLMGAMVAEARQIGQIERLTEPIRDMFSAVFFVAIGLLIEPRLLFQYAGPILVITLFVIVSRLLICFFGVVISGYDTRTALRVGMGLAPIGEFSFVIASLGLSAGVTSNFLYPIIVTVSAITTLATPYLIRSSDCLVAWFERHVPTGVTANLELYARWMGQRGPERPNSLGKRLLRKWLWQIALNIALVMAIFIAAALVVQRQPSWVPQWLGGLRLNASVWLAAMLIGLPIFIAVIRKMYAVGMLVSEMSVSAATAGERAPTIRAIIAQTVRLAGVVGLTILVLALSTPILPLKLVWLLSLIILPVAWVFWRSMVKVYSKAQFALNEVLAQSPPDRHAVEEGGALSTMLKNAQMRAVLITSNSPGAGKLISELQLRSRTGASIVAIERDGSSIVNPGPEEEIHGGDRILLLGSEQQLVAAKGALGVEEQ